MDNNQNKLFKYRLRDLRRKSDLTGQELADLVGVGKTTISAWENGVNFPNNDTLSRLCKIFNVSSDYLLGITDTSIAQQKDNDIQLDDFQFALYGEVKDLTEEQKQTLLNMAKFLKDSNK